MKKQFASLCLTATLLLFCACAGSNKPNFNIHGQASQDGLAAYLYNGKTLVDSTVVSNGSFAIQGHVDTPYLATLYLISEEGRALEQARLVVEAGSIEVGFDNTLGGTPLNDSLHAFTGRLATNDLDQQLATYLGLYYAATDAKSRSEAETLYDSVDNLRMAFITNTAWQTYHSHPADLIGAYAMELIAQNGNYTFAQFDSILSNASPIVANHAPVASKYEQLRQIEATSAGHHYTDLQGVDGKLSDLVEGQLTLVDFWASWCGPCRAEIRDNLIPLYAKYKDKGLAVVGVNVWERGDRAAREAAHAKAMADLGITYPQLVDSTTNATTTYGITGIPQILLIGPDGTILARDLRGSAIEETVLKYL